MALNLVPVGLMECWDNQYALVKIYRHYNNVNDGDVTVNYTISGTGADKVDLTSGSVTIKDGEHQTHLEIGSLGTVIGEENLNITITSSTIDTIGSNNSIDIKVRDTEGLKSFPTAKGAGAYVTGGRGGQVIHVTNLNDSGAGSLREAIYTSGARTIVFDVSGTIELLTDVYLYEGNLTIAGQTAPSPGITITGKTFKMSNTLYQPLCDNVIFRYFRMRPDFVRNGLDMAIQLSNIKNVIIDHVSISWAGDKAIGVADVTQNLTVQNTLIGECNTGMIIGQNLHGDDYTSKDCTVVHNIFYDSSHRFPNPGGTGRFDVINNVGYNYRYRLINESGNLKLNAINNYYDKGNYTPDEITAHKVTGTLTPVDELQIYFKGNRIKGWVANEDFSLWRAYGGGTTGWTNDGITYPPNSILPEETFRTDTEFEKLGASYEVVESGASLIDELIKDIGYNKILNEDGTTENVQDSIDERFFNHMSNRTYTSYIWNEDWATYQHYIDWHNTVSSTPINTRDANFDTNGDGIPDIWTDENMPEGATYNDIAPSGYTWLEEYLNEVDKVLESIKGISSVDAKISINNKIAGLYFGNKRI